MSDGIEAYYCPVENLCPDCGCEWWKHRLQPAGEAPGCIGRFCGCPLTPPPCDCD